MDFITAPLVTGIVFYFTYMVFELFTRRKERMALIEKMGQNLTPPDPSVLKSQLQSLLPSFPAKSFSGLRAGCLLVGLGLGLFVGLFTCIYLKHSDMDIGEYRWERDMYFSVTYSASLLFFGGLGLLVSFIIENRAARRDGK
ncbi:MAG: hypothetical protein LBJ47_06730 [Tannerella sp.]|jgi:hypothetical protein|nr:hypothetical protein [Tannerella sp.]